MPADTWSIDEIYSIDVAHTHRCSDDRRGLLPPIEWKFTSLAPNDMLSFDWLMKPPHLPEGVELTWLSPADVLLIDMASVATDGILIDEAYARRWNGNRRGLRPPMEW